MSRSSTQKMDSIRTKTTTNLRRVRPNVSPTQYSIIPPASSVGKSLENYIRVLKEVEDSRKNSSSK